MSIGWIDKYGYSVLIWFWIKNVFFSIVLIYYSEFSGKAPGGGVFIFASLKLNQEKIPALKTSFISYKLIMQQKQKSKAWNLRKAPGGGVFIFASLAKKGRKKSYPYKGAAFTCQKSLQKI